MVFPRRGGSQLAHVNVHPISRPLLWIEVQIFRAAFNEGLARHNIEQNQGLDVRELLWACRHGDDGGMPPMHRL